MLNEPVVGEQFFGRSEILAVIQKRIDALKNGYRQNIALTGQSLAGKSSILHHLLYNLRDEKIIPVYIEVAEEPFVNFSRKFVGSLLYNFLKGIGQPVREDVEFLISEAKQFIPNTVAAIERLRDPLEKTSWERMYSELFNLTSFIKEETHKSCVIIFDEFHNLAALGLKNPFSIFGKKIMVQKDTMYIVTSSKVSSVKRILSEKLSLLFGNFEAIEVSGFDTKTAKEFLDGRLKAIRMPEEYKEFLISFTDNNPFYLDVLSSRLKQLGERFTFKRIAEETIVQAFHDVIFDFKGTVNQYLSNYIESVFNKREKLRENYMAILLALASGSNRAAMIADFTKKKRTDVVRYLSDLMEFDIVIKAGVFYILVDKMLGFWLKEVYQKKRSSIISYIPERANDFKENVRDTLNEFILESKKDLIEKIEKLLRLFNDEIVQIGYKKYNLPKFTDVKLGHFGHERAYLTGYVKEKVWLVYIKDGELKDIDIIELAEQCKASGLSMQRKIIIVLSGADINAQLLAKEEKIWLWDMDTLNLLMSVYGRVRIASFYFEGRKKQ